MTHTLILIHGRSFKPPSAPLRRLWIDALRHAINRDNPETLEAFETAHKEFVYYGDISNTYLEQLTGRAAPDDARSRRATLRALMRYDKADFANRSIYENLPGKSSVGEALADALAGPLALLRLSQPAIHFVAPDMREYWNPDSELGSRMREPMTRALRRAFNRKGPVAIIAHSLGSLIAWDALWKFSHTSEYRHRYANSKVDLLITIGSPLGDETVKRNLKGARADGTRRYPTNIRGWLNIAAKDDYISHDQRIANDYRAMLDAGLVESITDRRIYNLAVRRSDTGRARSNPHHSGGYLVHPVTSRAMAAFLIQSHGD